MENSKALLKKLSISFYTELSSYHRRTLMLELQLCPYSLPQTKGCEVLTLLVPSYFSTKHAEVLPVSCFQLRGIVADRAVPWEHFWFFISLMLSSKPVTGSDHKNSMNISARFRFYLLINSCPNIHSAHTKALLSQEKFPIIQNSFFIIPQMKGCCWSWTLTCMHTASGRGRLTRKEETEETCFTKNNVKHLIHC